MNTVFIDTFPKTCYTYWESKKVELENILYSENEKQQGKNLLKEYETKQIGEFDEFQEHVSSGKLDSKTIQKWLKLALYEFITHLVQDNIIFHQKRLDGRQLDETRKITAQIDVLPMVHGSSLFQRGETQVVNVLTLGTLRDVLELDGIEDIYKTNKRYIHHYNFPSYSVGETGRYNGTGRREIGHGALAEKALSPVIPDEDSFPYTMRLVSECLGSNGSTSMASTCASSLSLMAAGVPIKYAIAGVAMGLAFDYESGKYEVLTDIQGLEDHHADMDFKVTGSVDGITAIQLDNKIGGMTSDVLIDALSKAKKARLHILSIMNAAIANAKEKISEHAPQFEMIMVPEDKIRAVIGSGGAVINGLQLEFGVDIDLENETGKCMIYGSDLRSVISCRDRIHLMVKDYAVGEEITGVIFRIEPFGAFFKIDNSNNKDAMIHISELGQGVRIEKVEDAVKIGDKVKCQIREIEGNGKMKLKYIGKV
jgi:polyribonucleotide nucleotidyltransferase